MNKDIVLEDYQVSATNGFLPSETPLRRLPPYYNVWESICSNLSTLRLSGALTSKVAEMPVLDTQHLTNEAEWRRAYVLLGYIAHAYIWGPEEPLDVGQNEDPLMGLTADRYFLPILQFPCSLFQSTWE